MIWTTQPRSKPREGLNYVRAGDGPALVLIHGVGLRAEAWSAMLPYLAPHYKVFAVDMPGHADSDFAYSRALENYVEPIQKFVENLEGPVGLIGHSMGAMIALEIAASLPDKISGVAALNAIFRRSEAATKAVQNRAAQLDGATQIDPTSTLERWFGARPVGDMQKAAEACGAWLTAGDPRGYADAYHVFAHHDGPADALLAGLGCPALFLTGDGDLNSTPAMSEAMAKRAPNGTALSIQGAAHMAPMTHAAEVAAAILESFVPERAKT